MDNRDQAAEVKSRRTASRKWIEANFASQWTQVFKSYRCERDPEKDPNDESKIDLSQTSIGMPDTWALVRRQVARITAQPPNLRFRAEDLELGDRISRKLMFDWDRANVQRVQKKHVTQACLFGWSVRAWSWDCLEYPRTKRVDPLTDNNEDTKLILDQYSEQAQAIHQDNGEGYEPGSPLSMGMLLADHGRGSLLPVKYKYKKYEGPKADFLFIGDCFPEPNFQSLQSSNWFIVRRRRNKTWLKKIAEAFKEHEPKIEQNIQAMLDQHQKGTANNYYSDEENFLRRAFMGVAERVDDSHSSTDSSQAANWTITECHVPGEKASLTLVGEDNHFICEIPYPYDLDGKIAFTELVLIDDILTGIGDSHARIIRGLQQLHDRQTSVRVDAVNSVLRPLVWCTNTQILENPGMLKRGPGFRLVEVNGPNEIGVLGEQSALSSIATGLQDEEAIMRALQMATGESNMSQAANVDPQQNRTATGARLMAYNMDILSKDANDMFTATSLNEDAEMMYLLNRSEMPEAVTFDGSRYTRNYDSVTAGAPTPQPMAQNITVTPHDFQIDGEVEAEAGSTLADDDEAKVQKAHNLFAQAVANPQIFNVQTAAKEMLIAMGKGKDIAQWLAPPQPPPPDHEPLRESVAVSVKLEMLPPEVQALILEKAGLIPPTSGPPVDDMGGPPPSPEPGPGGPPPGAAPPDFGSESEGMPIGPAVLAAEGKSNGSYPQ